MTEGTVLVWNGLVSESPALRDEERRLEEPRPPQLHAASLVREAEGEDPEEITVESSRPWCVP